MKKLPGIPLKQFLYEESRRLNICTVAVFGRITRGKYPTLRKHYASKRTVNVTL